MESTMRWWIDLLALREGGSDIPILKQAKAEYAKLQ
jgi:hypothetical protein